MNWLWHMLTDGITDLLGGFIGSLWADKFKDAAKNAAFKMDPETRKQNFPEQAKTSSHQSRWAILTDKLADGKEKALEEYFLSKLGPNQRANFVIRMAEMAELDEAAALRHLERIAAKADDTPEAFAAMVRIAVSNEFMKESEGDYPIGWVKNWFGTHNIADFFQNLGWVRGIGLLILVWGLLRSKPDDFLKAFTRIKEINAELQKKGMDEMQAFATAVRQGTREVFGALTTAVLWPFKAVWGIVTSLIAIPFYALAIIPAGLLLLWLIPWSNDPTAAMIILVILGAALMWAIGRRIKGRNSFAARFLRLVCAAGVLALLFVFLSSALMLFVPAGWGKIHNSWVELRQYLEWDDLTGKTEAAIKEYWRIKLEEQRLAVSVLAADPTTKPADLRKAWEEYLSLKSQAEAALRPFKPDSPAPAFVPKKDIWSQYKYLDTEAYAAEVVFYGPLLFERNRFELEPVNIFVHPGQRVMVRSLPIELDGGRRFIFIGTDETLGWVPESFVKYIGG